MARKPSKDVPSGKTIKQQCLSLGPSVWKDFWQARDRYKMEGLAPAEAVERTYKEKRIAELYDDWRKRETQREILGRDVPLTPAEIKEIHPDYQAPSVTNGGEVGEAVLSLPEQVRWVKQKLAQVRNGGDQPTSFPNADVLYWYQIAMTRPQDFDKIVLKIEAPEKDAEDAMMRDGEFQFSQIEAQIRQAAEECGSQLRDIEQSLATAFDGVLPSCPEGAGVEPAVSA
jgi:hypothetical protein